MAEAALEADLAALLETFEQQLVESAVAGSPFVTEAARHIIDAGGKRFRPLLVFLSSRFGGDTDRDDLMRAALVMELTHVASLYHDDVMDAADLRRGAPSANRLWGNSVAILVGDFLFARASTTVAELGVEYVMLQAETFSRLVQGQIAETKGHAAGEDPLAHYLQVIADKTGSLIAASARFGGMVSGASPETLAALSAFGEEVGLVFQLSDDLIDITSTSTGKTPGTDLREGVPTLPVLLLRASATAEDARLLELTSRPLHEEAEVAEALTLLRAHPVMDEARAEVARRAELARGYLSVLPAGSARDALSALCDQVAFRSA